MQAVRLGERELHQALIGKGITRWRMDALRMYVRGERLANREFMGDVAPILETTVEHLMVREASLENLGRHGSGRNHFRAALPAAPPPMAPAASASLNGQVMDMTPIRTSRSMEVSIAALGLTAEADVALVKVEGRRMLRISIEPTPEQVLEFLDL
jgi:hypothetical protein